MEQTIGSIADKMMENRLKCKDSVAEGLLCVGPRSCGKTSLLNAFLDKDDPKPKETIGLEYTFGRKSIVGQYGEKSICHVWELGGGILPTKELLKVPTACGGTVFALVMVDLSQGPSLWTSLRDYILKITENISCQLYIVGGRYDLYKHLDEKQRHQITKMLRAVALLTKCGLFMFSTKEPVLLRKSRDILSHLVFGSNTNTSDVIMKTYLGDTERPLQVAPGARDDSWETLGYSGPPHWSDVGKWLGVSILVSHNEERPQQYQTLAVDPSLDVSYREPLIDELRTQKDYQLELVITSRGRNYF